MEHTQKMLPKNKKRIGIELLFFRKSTIAQIEIASSNDSQVMLRRLFTSRVATNLSTIKNTDVPHPPRTSFLVSLSYLLKKKLSIFILSIIYLTKH